MRYAIPLVVLAALLVLFILGLQRDPHLVPSPLVGKAAPAFDLPDPNGPAPRLALADLHGAPALVNFFASWCAGCQEEHPFLLELTQNAAVGGGVKLVGIDYKDASADLHDWLARRGNPYLRIGADLDGKTGIDWGVYGVPETFVVDADGMIIFKQIGPLTRDVWEQQIKPLLAARGGGQGPGGSSGHPSGTGGGQP
jgi:cytochrome c biogenesis protein CcmG/thiol:disulfide interchange protein DsbE